MTSTAGDRYLLDTHTLLWWFSDSRRLPTAVRSLLRAPEHVFFASAASGWEIATKARIGRLDEFANINSHYLPLVSRNGFRELPITTRHSLRAGSIEHLHRDPFDRMLAAQSILEDLPILTTDPALASLGATTVW